ncbi:UDP-glucose dehydrogenase family protein [Saccharomonospora iraqiensis]|uniref:UDP-glucose dehydrogenase family protein n=1 Tax=Saccharomonospora iraqiensis TaxID=52698 RepID=UPI00022E0410|nr:UDP-glucose/GDP-mannose dehydrogenase family protein [Saccharomonospora iraqiensis]
MPAHTRPRGPDATAGGLPVGVVGTGYVGLTTAACLARLGHTVAGVDVDPDKVDALNHGEVDLGEPGLADLVRAGRDAGSLGFTTDPAALGAAGVVVVCVPTPSGPDGTADLAVFDSVLAGLAPVLAPDCVVAVKSTVPVGTTARAGRVLDRATVSNPEFLREGHAAHDFLHPDRIVLGADDPTAAGRVAALYAGLDAPVLRTDPASAELAKYASNAFLALKVSYVNVLAELCERVGADVGDVADTLRRDPRIGSAFLTPGPGWGGSCLPKDTRALLRTAEEAGVDFALLADAIAANRHQHDRVARTVREAITGSADGALAGVRIGLLGLTFKAGTDDVRDSPALAVAARLAVDGAVLTAYDPGIGRAAAGALTAAGVQSVDDPVLVAKDAAGLVLLTEWPRFRDLDWAELADHTGNPVLVDTRGLLDPGTMAGAGWRYHRLGRGRGEPGPTPG